MKKGVLFSLILILIAIILFSILILQRETISFEREQLSLKQQLKDMDYAYNSIERSLHILADVTTKRAIVSSLSYIVENQTFFESGKTEDNLKELILNGTLNGTEIPFMKNNTLEKTINDLEIFYIAEPRKYNVNINLDSDKISITPDDAFHILFNATAEVNISKDYVASLSRNLEISERISIDGFEDVLYLINITKGRSSRAIKKSKYIEELPWDNTTYVNTTFTNHVENGEYINSTSGPSFFDRLEGKTTCSYCTGRNVGLETFVDKNHLLWLGLDIDKNATNIAYKYIHGISGESRGFNETSTGSPSFKYFKIDNPSYSNYFE
jgi:hypothetical protein